MKSAAALLAGLLFGAGLCISGMTWPAKVTGFLDVAGAWDPSLVFVMAGAVGTYAVCGFFIRRRGAPLLAGGFEAAPAAKVDPRLLGGAAIFGIGWGLSGYCPGPAIVSLAALAPVTLVFMIAVCAGMIAARRLLTVIAVGSLSLAACSDAREGSFVGGPVIGLHYQTLTRSGLTDASGTFTYDEGETVTFTVGGVVLGTTEGKDRVSPFDLFGTPPPTNALELRKLLRDDVVTDFDRAANVMLFLRALDADRDPANGIDVTSWGATLAGVPFGFDYDFADFALGSFQRFAAAYPGVDRHLDVASVLPQLYGALGLAVTSRVATSRTTDYGNDGSKDLVENFTVDDLGRVIRVRGDSNGNDIIDRDDFTSYDPRGQVTLYEYRRDAGEDGSFERIESYAYVFDDDGNNTSAVIRDTTNGVIGLEQAFVSTFDVAGNLTSILQRNDNGGNGSVESSRRETRTYDRQGRIIASRIETDVDGDDLPDNVSTQTRAWSEDGYLAQTITERDNQGDGVVDSRESVVYGRDQAGRALTQTSEVMAAGVVITRSQTLFTYDSQGHRLTYAYAEDSNADGVIDYRASQSTTYVEDGRPLDEVTTTDDDADGVPSYVSTMTRTYDAELNLLAEVSERDADGDGVVDSRITNERSHDELGNQLTRLSRADLDNDGVVDSQTFEVTAYTDIADGLYRLVHELVVD